MLFAFILRISVVAQRTTAIAVYDRRTGAAGDLVELREDDPRFGG